ncbi:bifunctional nuclease family protein [Sulfurihydrogenibium subterraneum]|uniref:bifunctional nuclease family protein n=1 Tax=Sulfurihydrogenibium subterraneum TaxID=171121 RepID=UPI001FE17FF9|nr:bifunctional nuclease family protein [Sulfurihydrogenibium subterraneum]
MMVEMDVQGITLDPITNMPVLVLKGKETNDILTIWIGVFEANSIAMYLECMTYPRPLTYDLITTLIESLSSTVEKVNIHTVKDNTFYASIILKDANGNIVEVDARPSDAVNIALRSGSPIYVSQEVLNQVKNGNKEIDLEEEDIKEWIDSLKPEDFEKNIEF